MYAPYRATPVETKPDVLEPLALESLVAWLEKMPKDKVYCYQANGECLLAQYFTALGYREVSVDTLRASHTEGVLDFSAGKGVFSDFNVIAVAGQRTFGAALSRARAALEACACGTGDAQ